MCGWMMLNSGKRLNSWSGSSIALLTRIWSMKSEPWNTLRGFIQIWYLSLVTPIRLSPFTSKIWSPGCSRPGEKEEGDGKRKMSHRKVVLCTCFYAQAFIENIMDLHNCTADNDGEMIINFRGAQSGTLNSIKCELFKFFWRLSLILNMTKEEKNAKYAGWLNSGVTWSFLDAQTQAGSRDSPLSGSLFCSTVTK